MRRILSQNLAANRVTNATVMRQNLGAPYPVVWTAAGKQGSAEGLQQAHVAETLHELLLVRLDWLKINDGIGALNIFRGGTQIPWRLRSKLFLAVGPKEDRVANGSGNAGGAKTGAAQPSSDQRIRRLVGINRNFFPRLTRHAR